MLIKGSSSLSSATMRESFSSRPGIIKYIVVVLSMHTKNKKYRLNYEMGSRKEKGMIEIDQQNNDTNTVLRGKYCHQKFFARFTYYDFRQQLT
jgi:hypothetical protein